MEKWYKDFYNSTSESLNPWVGEARDLNDKITLEEVTIAISKLNNNKSQGIDQISTELIKYSGQSTAEIITHMFNNIFSRHQSINSITEGILIPLNKPNKQKIAENTRPITLLTTIRKVLSNVVLGRIYDKIDNHISQNQSGFRRYRSTTDVIWTYKW